MALNFGQIRERYEKITGETVDIVTLGSRIDEAQIEIAKYFGRRSTSWYPPAVTTLAAGVDADAETIQLVSGLDMPDEDATVYAYLGTGAEAELISYDELVGDQLQDVERGLNDDANEWPIGTSVSIPVQAEIEEDLPDDFLIVHEVRDLDNMPFFGYQISEDMRILFFRSGLYKLIYTRVPEPIDITDNSAVPEVHAVFHNDILNYCIAKHWEDLGEGIPNEENKANNMKANFYWNVERAAKVLRRNVNQQYTIGVGNPWKGE